MTQQEQFGKRLRQLRREKSAAEHRDVEQGEVAAAIGDTQPNYARWEKGRIPKEDETVRALAAFYGVSFVWLRYEEGKREPGEGERAPHPQAKTPRKRAKGSAGAKTKPKKKEREA